MAFSKLDLLNGINELVERYIEGQLAEYQAQIEAIKAVEEDDGNVSVVDDMTGHYVDLKTGDIWDLEKQLIVGKKDLITGKCDCHPERNMLEPHASVSEESFNKLVDAVSSGNLPVASITSPVPEDDPITAEVSPVEVEAAAPPEESITPAETIDKVIEKVEESSEVAKELEEPKPKKKRPTRKKTIV